jgi:hypothetical protein
MSIEPFKLGSQQRIRGTYDKYLLTCGASKKVSQIDKKPSGKYLYLSILH